MHINEAKHRVVGNEIRYWNGIKWLVREFRKDEKEAKERYKMLKEIKNLKDA